MIADSHDAAADADAYRRPRYSFRDYDIFTPRPPMLLLSPIKIAFFTARPPSLRHEAAMPFSPLLRLHDFRFSLRHDGDCVACRRRC